MNQAKTFDKKDTQAVKGIAIILLLFYHLFESKQLCTSMNVNHTPFSQEVFLLLSGYGNICVAVFAFLSAYGITKGLHSDNPQELLKGAVIRCRKLILNFIVMYLSVNLLWCQFFDYKKLYGNGWQGGFLALLDMFGLAQFFDTPTLNMTWWYMELAILIVFSVPFLAVLEKKTGRYIIILGLLLPFILDLNSDFKRYFIVILMGVVCANENWLEKLFSWTPFSKSAGSLLKIILGILLIMISVLFRQNYLIHTHFLWIVDAAIAPLLCWFIGEFISNLPIIGILLRFLGKHSMNIYFVHTFFYLSIYQKFIYSFRYAGVILVVLLLITLLYSVILEVIKKIAFRLLTHLFSKKTLQS